MMASMRTDLTMSALQLRRQRQRRGDQSLRRSDAGERLDGRAHDLQRCRRSGPQLFEPELGVEELPQPALVIEDLHGSGQARAANNAA